MRTIGLNLASRPLRNRRLYFALGWLLGTLLAVTAVLAVMVYVRFYLKSRALKSRLTEIETKLAACQRDERRFSIQTRDAVKRDQATIDLVNRVILRKTFSWMEFLSRLEESLPASSYLTSLDPQEVGESRAQFRFKVVSRSSDDLLALIASLQAWKSSQIRVESEERTPQGQLMSEISVSYERSL
jgi:Tfp pilus assembly protein PilN